MPLSTEFLGYFSELEDYRVKNCNFRHEMTDILAISILAILCGADNWVEISSFGHNRQDWLKEFLALPHGIPSHDTFGRVFSILDVDVFEECFLDWTQSLVQKFERTRKEIISIDGKTSRRSHNRRKGKNPLHMVSAWASDQNLVLGQVSTNEKSNEIEAIPRLLNMIDVKDAIVTIDGMGCQKEIASQIVEKQGDYILTLKNNQPNLAEGVKAVFRKAEVTHYEKMDYLQKIEKVKGHGRTEQRKYTLISCKDKWMSDAMWPRLRSIGMLEVKRIVNHETIYETRYFLTSLPYDKIDDFMRGVRNHWNIEINLHWSLDVSFADDLNRARTKNVAENLSILKRIALNMLKQEKTAKVGITAKRKMAGWNNVYLLSLFNS